VKLDASEASSSIAPRGAIRQGLRTRPAVRVGMVALALVWTQFPLGGGAKAEGGRELALCCAWGRTLDDSELTYSVRSADLASAEVVRQAVREWDADLPALRFAELPVGAPVDIAIAYQPAPGRTQGQAVTSFNGQGLIRHVDVTIEGVPAPANAGGLLQIAKHEFGHALGLGHANFDGSLMSAAVSPEPQPIEPCVLHGVAEANGWKLLSTRSPRPARPELTQVPC